MAEDEEIPGHKPPTNDPVSDDPPLLEDDDFESTNAGGSEGNLWIKIALGVVVSIALVTGVMYVKGIGPFEGVIEKTPFDDDAELPPAPSALPPKVVALPDPPQPASIPTDPSPSGTTGPSGTAAGSQEKAVDQAGEKPAEAKPATSKGKKPVAKKAAKKTPPKKKKKR